MSAYSVATCCNPLIQVLQAIAPLLFETLARNERLAALVRKLEIRVFPISLKITEQAKTQQLAIDMLQNCVNCEELVWTRKGALTDHHLALEACQLEPTFYTQAALFLRQLRSIKLTHPGPRHPALSAFFPAVESLLADLPHLSAFTLYYSGAATDGRRDWPTLPDDFVRNVTASNGARLRKFEVSGILTSVTAIETLAAGARELRNLVLHLGDDFDLARLMSAFAPLPHLRTLHLLSQRATVSVDAVQTMAERCSPTLRQIGFRNRVWIVKRTYDSPADNRPKVSLGPYDLPWWPEALLVLRFVETAAAFGAFRRNRYGAESDVETEVEEASSASSGNESDTIE
ncbi:hypothetical protein JCM8202v2_001653 [Rhodotorula sphaerocarpa]